MDDIKDQLLIADRPFVWFMWAASYYEAYQVLKKEHLARCKEFFSLTSKYADEKGVILTQNFTPEEAEFYQNWHASNLSHSLNFLLAHAVELYLKGLIVQANQGMYKDSDRKYIFKKMPEELVSHNLIKLSPLAGIKLDENEVKILKLLTESVDIRGKYPGPRNILVDGMCSFDHLNRKRLPGGFGAEEDIKILEGVFKKIFLRHKELEALSNIS